MKPPIAEGASRSWHHQTWHGTPDCRCNIDIRNMDPPEERYIYSSSDTSLGRKTLIKMKRSSLRVPHLNQMIGNVVIYSFVHNNKHGDQNRLVPVLGLSGGQGTMTVVM